MDTSIDDIVSVLARLVAVIKSAILYQHYILVLSKYSNKVDYAFSKVVYHLLLPPLCVP
jgi:hypothetical protein